MAKMNKKRIKEMNLDEKEKKLVEYKTELAYQRALLAAGNTSESPGKIRSIKKTIARLNTFINIDNKKQA
ncbi:MAG: 50S ribosomal protein L29 [Candidatus Lokiarchaeota archaeon]|nr:50S ribosomal protein L29 [Candidatus Lokiarchaeota archaeon]